MNEQLEHWAMSKNTIIDWEVAHKFWLQEAWDMHASTHYILHYCIALESMHELMIFSISKESKFPNLIDGLAMVVILPNC
jgi:hypothetical protein